jgi:hypothetical protein
MSDRVIPFANGSEFMFWSERNCDRCKRGTVEGEECPISGAILDGLVLGGATGAV